LSDLIQCTGNLVLTRVDSELRGADQNPRCSLANGSDPRWARVAGGLVLLCGGGQPWLNGDRGPRSDHSARDQPHPGDRHRPHGSRSRVTAAPERHEPGDPASRPHPSGASRVIEALLARRSIEDDPRFGSRDPSRPPIASMALSGGRASRRRKRHQSRVGSPAPPPRTQSGFCRCPAVCRAETGAAC
jgi:hypothetical protein